MWCGRVAVLCAHIQGSRQGEMGGQRDQLSLAHGEGRPQNWVSIILNVLSGGGAFLDGFLLGSFKAVTDPVRPVLGSMVCIFSKPLPSRSLCKQLKASSMEGHHANFICRLIFFSPSCLSPVLGWTRGEIGYGLFWHKGVPHN